MIEPGYIIHSQNNESFIMHRSHKYIDKIKTSKGWRYIYKKSGAEARDKYYEMSSVHRNAVSDLKNENEDVNRRLNIENMYKNWSDEDKDMAYKTFKKAGVKFEGSHIIIPSTVDRTLMSEGDKYLESAQDNKFKAKAYKQSRKDYERNAQIYRGKEQETKFKSEMAKNEYYKTPLGKVDKALEKIKKKKKGN